MFVSKWTKSNNPYLVLLLLAFLFVLWRMAMVRTMSVRRAQLEVELAGPPGGTTLRECVLTEFRIRSQLATFFKRKF